MSEERELTYGEELVRVSFNPSEDEDVRNIKEAVANLIDYINETGADHRCKALAITNLEQAAMWAVKSVTAKKG